MNVYKIINLIFTITARRCISFVFTCDRNWEWAPVTIDDAAGNESVKKCLLCGDTERQKSRYGTWGGLERTYLEHHLGHSPTDNSYLCKKHLLEARRYGHDKDHVPSWKECMPNPPIKQNCFNPNCTNKSPERLIKPMFIPNKLMDTLGIKQPPEVNQPLILCHKCYNVIMKHMLQTGSRIPCSSCRVAPKSSTAFCWHSPDTEKVSQLLTDNTGQDVSINPVIIFVLLAVRHTVRFLTHWSPHKFISWAIIF